MKSMDEIFKKEVKNQKFTEISQLPTLLKHIQYESNFRLLYFPKHGGWLLCI